MFLLYRRDLIVFDIILPRRASWLEIWSINFYYSVQGVCFGGFQCKNRPMWRKLLTGYYYTCHGNVYYVSYPTRSESVFCASAVLILSYYPFVLWSELRYKTRWVEVKSYIASQDGFPTLRSRSRVKPLYRERMKRLECPKGKSRDSRDLLRR
jgi:hypothetical protein